MYARVLSILLSSTTGAGGRNDRFKSSSLFHKNSSSSTLTLPRNNNIVTKFILTDTLHPGNVGAAARAMKTMGFDDLSLIRPHDDRVLGRKKCIDSASGAMNILKNAKIFGTLDDFLEHENGSNVILCGTGMPVDMSNERPRQQYVAPRKYFERIRMDTANFMKEPFSIAFVFGNERMGMLPLDMEKCDVMLGIPTNPSFGSLNLASAVQLIAYDWREAIGGFDATNEKATFS